MAHRRRDHSPGVAEHLIATLLVQRRNIGARRKLAFCRAKRGGTRRSLTNGTAWRATCTTRSPKGSRGDRATASGGTRACAWLDD